LVQKGVLVARPASVWYRPATGWWMVTLGGKKVKLLRGPDDAPTRQLAEEAWIEKRKLQRERPGSVNATLADLVDSFLDWSKRNLADDTYRIHRYYGGSLSDWCGDVPAADVRPFHVTGWISFMTDPKRLDAQKGARLWGEHTIYTGRRFAFRVMNWAKDEGLIPVNPLAGMRRPKPQTGRRAMTEDEFDRLHAAAAPAFADFLFALLETGARPKELRDLLWDDVQGQKVVLAKHKTSAKTGQARVITLTKAMLKMLKRRRADGVGRHVFVNVEGQPWTMNAVRLQMSRLRKKLNLASDLVAYLARHGFGTRAILAGVDPLTVATLMGHKSLEMVSKVYVHLSDQTKHLEDAVERINTPRPKAKK
jgi:integrase